MLPLVTFGESRDISVISRDIISFTMINWLVEGNNYRRIPYFMGKSMVSCRLSLKSIHWYDVPSIQFHSHRFEICPWLSTFWSITLTSTMYRTYSCTLSVVPPWHSLYRRRISAPWHVPTALWGAADPSRCRGCTSPPGGVIAKLRDRA